MADNLTPVSFSDLMMSAERSRLCILCKAHDYADFWKVGKLNHNKAVEQSALGPKFYKSSSS